MGVVLNAVSTDDTRGGFLPKYDLVINELKCVVVLCSVFKTSLGITTEAVMRRGTDSLAGL